MNSSCDKNKTQNIQQSNSNCRNLNRKKVKTEHGNKTYKQIPQNIDNLSPDCTNKTSDKTSKGLTSTVHKNEDIDCRKYGVLYEPPVFNEREAHNRQDGNSFRKMQSLNESKPTADSTIGVEKNEQIDCKKYGVLYEPPTLNETRKEARKRHQRNRYRIRQKQKVHADVIVSSYLDVNNPTSVDNETETNSNDYQNNIKTCKMQQNINDMN